VNWTGISELSNSGINYQNFSQMTTSNINWTDVAAQTTSGINWEDVSAESHGGINWQGLAASSTTGVNWAGINTMITDVSKLVTLVGTQDNAQGTDTLFHLLNTVNAQTASLTSSGNVSQILTAINSVQTTVGTIQNLIGSATSTATNTLFGSLNGPNSNVVNASNNAAAAMSLAQQIINDLGVNGATPNMYAKLKNMEDDIQNIQQAATQLVNGNENQPSLPQDTIDKLTNFLNQQAKQAGLQKTLGVAELSKRESQDMEKVNEKLEEIDAKISALREALNVQDVVVKSYYESD